MFSDLAPSLPLIASGKVRALGVTSLTRWPTAPDIPPLNEAGVPGFDAVGLVHGVGPAGTPQPIVERLHDDLKAVMGSTRRAAGGQPDRGDADRQSAARRAAEVHREPRRSAGARS